MTPRRRRLVKWGLVLAGLVWLAQFLLKCIGLAANPKGRR
jgi:hypothetical protein